MSTSSVSPYSFATTIQVINNNFAIILLIGFFFCAGFIGGSLWTENNMLKSGGVTQPTVAAGGTLTQPTDAQPVGEPPVLTDTEHVRGNQNAQVTIIEYSDFECPFCAKFHPIMQQVMSDYGDKIKWVYRHYPLSFHPNAQKAAEGSECVNKLAGNEAFWKYADAIFAENDRLGGKLTPESITMAAQAAGVNQTTFKACLDSGEFASKVADDLAGGLQAGVNGTPGSFVLTADGQSDFISGALPLEQVKQTLDKYVK